MLRNILSTVDWNWNNVFIIICIF